MNVMDKKLNLLDNKDFSSQKRNKIEEVAQLYFEKNEAYICKRIKHRLVEKIIKQFDGKNISKDQIQDYIYKYLKQIMGWIETGKSSVMELRQKNQETIRLKKKLMEQKMIQKQKDQKIERRNQRITKLKHLLEQESLNIKAKDIEEAKLTKQKQFYKELCGGLLNNLQQRNKQHRKLKKQLDEVKTKYRLAHSRSDQLLAQTLNAEIIMQQMETIRQQNNKLKSHLEKVEQSYVVLEQQYIRKQQECQLLKDNWESLTQNNNFEVEEHVNELFYHSKYDSSNSNTFYNISKPIDQNIELEISKATCVGDLKQKNKSFCLSSNAFNYTYNLQTFSFETQIIQDNIKSVAPKQNDQKQSSSQSQYIYECDFGIQCMPISTQQQFSQTEPHKIGQNDIGKDFQPQLLPSLNQKIYEEMKKLENERNFLSSTNKYLIEEKNNLQLQLEISRKTQQIFQKQIQQLKTENESCKAQFSELKNQLIQYFERDGKNQKNNDSKRLEQMETTISFIIKQNGELKKYNQQLMETIQYANSLLSRNQSNSHNVESKQEKNLSKNDYGMSNSLSYNWTQSTGSHFHELSQKSSESSVSKSEHKYTFQNENGEQKQCQSESQNSKQQHAREFKKTRQISLESQEQPQKSKQVQRYGMAVARLLSQFINSQNKQDTKMKAFGTLIQLIKPNAELKEQFHKFIKFRKRFTGGGFNIEDNPLKKEEEHDDIQNKLFRFLTSN